MLRSSTTFTHFLKTSRDVDSITSLDILFQWCTTLSVNKFLLIFNLNVPWCNLRPFPLVLILLQTSATVPLPLTHSAAFTQHSLPSVWQHCSMARFAQWQPGETVCSFACEALYQLAYSGIWTLQIALWEQQLSCHLHTCVKEMSNIYHQRVLKMKSGVLAHLTSLAFTLCISQPAALLRQ